ncbi:hypothetical protein [Nonomuraea bangladeshensis]|uniref:hypothetical protein n=1 Tax=Nonomuraea bangladeshensis TaxID=404385 RepID=UPI0031DEB229
MAITTPVYTTREAVKSALDVKLTARSDPQVDRAIESASRAVEGLLHRRFYPERRTMSFDWPNAQLARPWRLWLDANELIEVEALTVGGEEIPSSDYFLRPDDGPPYRRIEIDLDSSAAFSAGGTHQRAISITGVYGYRADESPAGVLAAALNATQTSVTVTDSAAIGVGDLIRVGDERMLVTGKAMASTGQTLQSPLNTSAADALVAVTDGTAYQPGEVILLDAERMLIVDVAGNSLVVKRAWDGSVLAAHTGSTVYALRALTVERGAVGTTAATHNSGAAIVRHEVPATVRELVEAEAINTLLQRQSGYARSIGSGENEREVAGRALREIRDQAYAMYGRKARIRGVS